MSSAREELVSVDVKDERDDAERSDTDELERVLA